MVSILTVRKKGGLFYLYLPDTGSVVIVKRALLWYLKYRHKEFSFLGKLIFVVLGIQRKFFDIVGYLRGRVVGQFVKIGNVLFRNRPERNTNPARLEVCQFSMKLWFTPGSYLGNTMIQTVLEIGPA
jgi:hypothetical protein